MAFSPDSKPFKNSAFCCSVEVMGKWEPVPFSLGNYSCRNEGVWGGRMSAWGEIEVHLKWEKKGWPWTPRGLLSSLPGPWDLWVKIRPLNFYQCFVHTSNLCLGSRAEAGEREKKTTQILFCWVSHLFENEMRGCSEMLMEIFANTRLKLLPSKESLSYKYVWVI